MSRVRVFRECRRKFYYQYLLAPRARRPNPPPQAGEAARVRSLMGLEAWGGSLVHEEIEKLLRAWKSRRGLNEAEVVERARKSLRERFLESQQYWREWHSPDRPLLLDRHYFGGGPLEPEAAARLRERVVGSLLRFYRSDMAERLRRLGPQQWLFVDRNAAVRLDGGVSLFVRPDCAFWEEGRLQIVDWKTGRAEPEWNHVQVACYVLYAEQQWRAAPTAIDPWLLYLHPEYHASAMECGPELVEQVLEFVHTTRAEIEEYLDPHDPWGLPPQDWFPIVEDRRRCGWCPFREICEGGQCAPET